MRGRVRPIPWLLLLLLCLALPGCAIFTVTADEQKTLDELESFGLLPSEAGTVPPDWVGLANAWGPIGLLLGPDLGVVPLGGAGNFFLASRVEPGSGQFWLGVLNSLTWPISPLWSVPQVVSDARIVNRKETAFHFTGTIRGVHEWRRMRAIARPLAPPGDDGRPGDAPAPVAPPGRRE